MYALKKPDSHKRRKRLGCGNSSGHGKTSGKGMKGQNARSGVSIRANFEGGQMPLSRRIPKRGFNNNFRIEYQIVSLAQLAKLTDSEVTVELLGKLGLIRSDVLPVKITGTGDVARSMKIHADAFTSSAKEKIEKSGGVVIARGK